FGEASSELLSKVMQGSDEKYRCSVAFEVRPVMIAAAGVPRYSLLVGVDYEHSILVGESGIHVPVLPAMGPVVADLSPSIVEPGDTLTITGVGLDLADLFVRFGPVELAVTGQQPASLRCLVDGAIPGGAVVSAGWQPVSVSQLLPH